MWARMRCPELGCNLAPRRNMCWRVQTSSGGVWYTSPEHYDGVERFSSGPDSGLERPSENTMDACNNSESRTVVLQQRTLAIAVQRQKWRMGGSWGDLAMSGRSLNGVIQQKENKGNAERRNWGRRQGPRTAKSATSLYSRAVLWECDIRTPINVKQNVSGRVKVK
jgi:hypothetical protein